MWKINAQMIRSNSTLTSKIFFGFDTRGIFHQHIYARAAFTHLAPNSIRNQLSCQYLFMLFGSKHAKAAHKMLMNLTLAVNFINVIPVRFSYNIVLAAFLQLHVHRKSCQNDVCTKKLYVKCDEIDTRSLKTFFLAL